MLELILNFLGNYFKVFANKAIKQELDILLPIATDAIKAIFNDTTYITSEEKRIAGIAYIFNRISSEHKDKQVSKSLINLALELAYQQFKLTNK